MDGFYTCDVDSLHMQLNETKLNGSVCAWRCLEREDKSLKVYETVVVHIDREMEETVLQL